MIFEGLEINKFELIEVLCFAVIVDVSVDSTKTCILNAQKCLEELDLSFSNICFLEGLDFTSHLTARILKP